MVSLARKRVVGFLRGQGRLAGGAASGIEVLYDGRCEVFESVPAVGRDGLLSGREEKSVLADVPCHLELTSVSAADVGSDGSKLAVCGKLFLAAEHEIKPGSRVRVEQGGRVYDLQCSGLPCVYADITGHQEIEVAALHEWA
jgi:hypothetical protein